LKYRGASIDAKAVGKRNGVYESAGFRVDANEALRSCGRRQRIIWCIAAFAIIAIDGLKLCLGADISGDCAEVEVLAVRVYQAYPGEAGRLFLQFPEEIGSVEGVLGANVGQKALLDRILRENRAKARKIGRMVALLGLSYLGKRSFDTSDQRGITETRLDYVEESREGRHGKSREEKYGY
jgi:hypothetical protein